MKFENIIKTISGTAAGLIVFLLASGMYLSAKGFIMGSDGKPVLVQTAEANENGGHKISSVINVNLPENYILGKKDAPLSIYEYSSMGCSHCAGFHNNTIPKIKEEFIDTGKVKIIFADFPLDKASLQASMVARCMPEDKYYDFLGLLFKKQFQWHNGRNAEARISEYASLNGLTKEKIQECLKDENISKELIFIREEGIEKLKIQGTPSILFVSKNGDKEIYYGAPGYDDLKKIIEEKLKNE